MKIYRKEFKVTDDQIKAKVFYSKEKDSYVKFIDKLKNTNKITTINGCFDILHFAHLQALLIASYIGDKLIVGLNSDKSIRNNKGENRPILNERERYLNLMVLPFVDYIYIYDEDTSEDFVRITRPNVHVNSLEYGENCVERPILEEYGGELYLINVIDESSTSKIIDRFLKNNRID